MGKVKNWMMEIEEFCDGYFYPDLGLTDFTIDEVVEDVGMYFKYDNAAKVYAREYLTKIMGEI